MENKKVIIWCSDIDNVYSGEGKVAGIQVQMSFWARIFSEKGWKVFSFTSRNAQKEYYGIKFIPIQSSKILNKLRLDILSETLHQLKTIFRIRPDLIICRGASRSIYALSVFSKLFGCRLVFMGASDVNFTPDDDKVGGARYNTKLYRSGLRKLSYFIVQNEYQSVTLKANYGKNSLIIPNVWFMSDSEAVSHKKYDAIWIANFRKLKRAEWVINLAKRFPKYRFAMAGGPNDRAYYEDIKQASVLLNNLDFLGPLPFAMINQLLSESKVLLCTSTYEGFPNTFLQAWAYRLPIVSTVNPNDSITTYRLGHIVETEDEFGKALQNILIDTNAYSEYQQNISNYFESRHNIEGAYDKLTEYIYG